MNSSGVEGGGLMAEVPRARYHLRVAHARDTRCAEPGRQVEGWVIVDSQWMRLDVFPLQNSTARSSVPLIGSAALHGRSVLLCRREALQRRHSAHAYDLYCPCAPVCAFSGCTCRVRVLAGACSRLVRVTIMQGGGPGGR